MTINITDKSLERLAFKLMAKGYWIRIIEESSFSPLKILARKHSECSEDEIIKLTSTTTVQELLNLDLL